MKKRFIVSLLLSVCSGCIVGALFRNNSTEILVFDRILDFHNHTHCNEKGIPKAPVTLVEFSDLDCPFSKKNRESIDSLKKRYPGRISHCFRHFPLSIHQYASFKAKAVIAADGQGHAESMRRLLFQIGPIKTTEETIKSVAEGLELDVDKFIETLHAKKTEDALNDDIRIGKEMGVRSTPTVFINGYRVKGAVGFDVYAKVIDKVLSLHL